MGKNINNISKSLSYWLRHNPDSIGIHIEENGWTSLDILIDKSGYELEDIKKVVDTSDKNRFSINDDCTKIRANQGHSIDIKFEFEKVIPPKFLYHGTSKRNMDLILKDGLKKMNRHHVHLSKDIETAEIVASRRKGDIVIFKVLALKMKYDTFPKNKYEFLKSENGVYLTDEVPSEYLEIL